MRWRETRAEDACSTRVQRLSTSCSLPVGAFMLERRVCATLTVNTLEDRTVGNLMTISRFQVMPDFPLLEDEA